MLKQIGRTDVSLETALFAEVADPQACSIFHDASVQCSTTVGNRWLQTELPPRFRLPNKVRTPKEISNRIPRAGTHQPIPTALGWAWSPGRSKLGNHAKTTGNHARTTCRTALNHCWTYAPFMQCADTQVLSLMSMMA